MIDAEAVLIDLYDTAAYADWEQVGRRLDQMLGLDRDVVHAAYEETYEERGTGRYATPEDALAAVIRACGIEPDPADVRDLVAERLAYLTGGAVKLYDDTLPVLRELRRCGIGTAIVSNCDNWTRPVVDALGLEDEADAVILSFEVGALKPDPAIFQAALERIGGVRPDRAVFVDDQARYCDGAAALGIDGRLIVRDGTAAHEWIGRPFIRELAELL